MAGRDRALTLRFLAAPTDTGYSGSVDGGRVLEWIDKAAYALAASWSGHYCVTAYVGNIRFTRPVKSGHLVEVIARLVHTGRSSMHIETVVRSGAPTDESLVETARCLVIFVAVDDDGRSTAVPSWVPADDDDRASEQRAIVRVALRSDIETAMAAQTYSAAGTAPSVVLRFLAAPTDVNWGGKVHGGIVMRWIDEAAHVLATQWTGDGRNVAVYAGGVRFYRPLRIGHLVEVEARLLHTGSTSMHVSVRVRSGDPAAESLELTTHCLIVFVSLSPDGTAAPVRKWVPVSAEDVALDAHAEALVQLRSSVELPPEPMRE